MKKTTLLIIAFCCVSIYLSAQHNYTDALYKTTYFYGAQRCGNTQSWSHNACHLLDGNDVGLDLTGGWHDCGDHIKFGHTGPFTAIVLLMGYEAATSSYADNYSPANSAPPSNGIPDILDEVKILTDFILKTVDNGTIYYQVGDSTDHASFHDPAWQSLNLPQSEGGNPRNTYAVTTGGANIAGAAASALALMSINYSPYNSTYATNCLNKSIEYYNIGKASTGAIPATSNGPGNEYYPADNWADEMALAAIHLYRATGMASYLTEAVAYYNNADFAVADWQPLITSYVNQLVHYELYLATSDNLYLNKLTDHMNEMYYHPDNCGYMHFADWGSLYYATNAAFMASLYHKLTGDADAYAFAKSNVDFCLGTHGFISSDAPANHSFVLGYDALGGGYSEHPHDATSFGKEASAWSLFTQETNNPGSILYDNPLVGALMGGPRSLCSNYIDNIDDYQGNETCTYYNSGLVSALAYVEKIESSPLPVEWLSPLAAEKRGDKIELSWQTALEENAAYFDIQRSIDGQHWQNIVKTQAKGVSYYYKVYDKAPLKGNNIYRLRQVDVDGQFQYSNTVSINWVRKNTSINIYPNPFSDQCIVEIEGEQSNCQCIIYNIRGELIKTVKSGDNNYIIVEKGNLTPGIYYIKTSDNHGNPIAKRIMIQ